MKVEKFETHTKLTADGGMGIIAKNDCGIVSSTEVYVAKNGNVDNYIELPLGSEYASDVSESDKDAALARFGVEVTND